jgi:Helix-turn-helix domain
MDRDTRTVGARLREIRKARGKSLTVIAGLAGISESYLSLLETGSNRCGPRCDASRRDGDTGWAGAIRGVAAGSR